ARCGAWRAQRETVMAPAVPDFDRVAGELRRVTAQVVDERERALGSGVITGPDTVVTNAHVATSRTLRVRLSTGALIAAVLKSTDHGRDLALLSLTGGQQLRPAATLRES